MAVQPIKKQSYPFGFPKTPFDPQTGKYFPLSDQRVVDTFTVVEEQSDVLICRDSGNRLQIVAKPYILQRYPFDANTVDGITYDYDTAICGKRTADDGATEETHLITPDYLVGEILVACKAKIYAALWEDDGNDETVVKRIDWADLNTAGRCWAVEAE